MCNTYVSECDQSSVCLRKFLTAGNRKRFAQKICFIGYVDLYKATLNTEDFPFTATVGHIVNYLVNRVIF